jgi:hypothetical protein
MLLAHAGWIQLLNHSKVVFDHNAVVCCHLHSATTTAVNFAGA